MSATGFTPIQLYYSTTAAATPSAGNLAAGELAVNITDGKLFYKDNGGVVRVLATAAGSAGDVVGPGSSTDNALVRFDGTTGKLVQSSVGVLSDAGALSGLTSVAATTFTGALTGNASTATTLQTSRTIWGQSFDGSANVTGALTGVTDLTASGSLTLNGGVANGVAYLNGSKVLTTGSALTFNGTSFGVPNIDLNNGGSQYLYSSGFGSYFQLTNNANALTFGYNGSEQMRLTSTGLGIGTSSPGAKLDVKGGAVFWGVSTSSRDFEITSDASFVQLQSYNSKPLKLNAQGNNVIIESNLGLGTTSPASRLAVSGGGVTIGGFQSGSGSTLELGFDGTQAIVQGYNRTGSAYLPVWIESSYTRFGTGGVERARIDSSGNLLVGTTSSAGTGLTLGNGKDLYLVATGYSSWKQVNYLGGFYLNNGSDRFIVLAGGEVKAPGIYNLTTGAGANVHVASDGTLYRSTSSLKYKTDVQDATHGLAQVMQLRPVTYKGNNDGELVFGGLIAEEVHEAGLTEFVQYAEDGTPDALAYANMVSLAFKAIQEQQAIINAQGTALNQLKADVAALKGA